MSSEPRLARRRIDVEGVVQGVGFRPHVARLANDLGLSGWVRNTSNGVQIEVQGTELSLERFGAKLVAHAPPLAHIERTRFASIAPIETSSFAIESSNSSRKGLAAIPPDTATCAACVEELFDPSNRRYRHAFITCTDCGPRWTIVTGLPYDRPRTTMADFDMCQDCADEYHDPKSRRHHAQPIACGACGPRLHRLAGTANTAGTSTDDQVLAATVVDVHEGRIVAIKGIGGFHLVVDATNDVAVARLRRKKHRPDKPFAIMVKDLAAARRFAQISDAEAKTLSDPARPIVLLAARGDTPAALSSLVAPNNPLIGIMLPYSPLHHLLFAKIPGGNASPPDVLVMTSGNIAGEPIVHHDADSVEKLRDLADSFCTHDRAIVVPCDDSVVRIIDGHESPIRRSRGYAPLPISLPFVVDPLLALGGDLKNTACVASGNRALLSQHLGDMDSMAAQHALELAVDGLSKLHDIKPQVVVADRHPGYRTTSFAHRFDLPVQTVGHHHAHLAALLAEHSSDPVTRVIGFLFDGTGWGDDDTLWGGETVIGNYDAIERRAALRPTRLPGGDVAVANPWRVALAHLAAAHVDSSDLAPRAQAQGDELLVVDHQISTGFNSPRTSSMGRLFDAVASLLDVRHTISHEAQAAIELEALAASASACAGLGFEMYFDTELGIEIVDPRPLIRSLVKQLRAGLDPAALALGFHHAVVSMIVRLAAHLRTQNAALTTVALSGGVFQNQVITRAAARRLEAEGFDVLTHRLVPANDGGLSLGQAVVVGRRLACRNVELSQR